MRSTSYHWWIFCFYLKRKFLHSFKHIIMRKLLMLLIIFQCTFYFTIQAQDKNIVKEKYHWGSTTQDTAAGYAQAVKVDNIIYMSGAVSRDVTPEGIKRVYEALGNTLKQYGATFQNVVKENLYTTDMEAMKKYNDARKAFYKNDFPAATWIQVSRLYMVDAKLEVELIAHLPK